jgi:glycosyltransferase involved in cell wall biosynthesis
MRNTPFFSIIIPTKNSCSTIKQCLTSILNQSFKHFEIVLCDAESNDSTIEIIESFYDERIKIFIGKDQGIYDAMNKGVKHSIGKYLYFLGSDDYLESFDVLQFVHSNIQNQLMVYGNVRTTSWGEKYDGPFEIEKLSERNICHQSIFYNRKCFRSKFFNLKYKIHADWDYNLRQFVLNKKKIKYLDKVISFYSTDGFSNTNSIDENFKKDKLKNILSYYFISFSLNPWRIFTNDSKTFIFFLKKLIRININSKYPEVRIDNPISNSIKYILLLKFSKRLKR